MPEISRIANDVDDLQPLPPSHFNRNATLKVFGQTLEPLSFSLCPIYVLATIEGRGNQAIPPKSSGERGSSWELPLIAYDVERWRRGSEIFKNVSSTFRLIFGRTDALRHNRRNRA